MFTTCAYLFSSRRRKIKYGITLFRYVWQICLLFNLNLSCFVFCQILSIVFPEMIMSLNMKRCVVFLIVFHFAMSIFQASFCVIWLSHLTYTSSCFKKLKHFLSLDIHHIHTLFHLQQLSQMNIMQTNSGISKSFDWIPKLNKIIFTLYLLAYNVFLLKYKGVTSKILLVSVHFDVDLLKRNSLIKSVFCCYILI